VNHVFSSATEYPAKDKSIHSNDEVVKYLCSDEFLSDCCIAAYFFTTQVYVSFLKRNLRDRIKMMSLTEEICNFDKVWIHCRSRIFYVLAAQRSDAGFGLRFAKSICTLIRSTHNGKTRGAQERYPLLRRSIIASP